MNLSLEKKQLLSLSDKNEISNNQKSQKRTSLRSELLKEWPQTNLYFFVCVFLGLINKVFITFRRRNINNIFKEIHEKNFNKYGIFKTFILSFFTFLSATFYRKISSFISENFLYYTSKIVMNKFSKLSFEDKINKKSEVLLIENFESERFSELWSHTAIHILTSLFSIIFSTYIYWNYVSDIYLKYKIFTFSIFFLLIFCNIFSFFLSFKIDKEEKKLKEEVKVQQNLQEKIVYKQILIESMGIQKEFLEQLRKVEERIRILKLNISSLSLYGKVFWNISNLFLLFSSLAVSLSSFEISDFFQRYSFLSTLNDDFSHLADSFKEVVNFRNSKSIIENFLSIREKNDNFSGFKASLFNVVKVSFVSVDFKYKNSSSYVIKNYENEFSNKNLNWISGKNGTGKSTILYLLLGILVPERGQILVHLDDERVFDLNKEVNLKDWREKVVLFASHENIFDLDEGSTGQRQLKNIKNSISNKKNAQIFLFDEAENSLDKENRSSVMSEIKKISSFGKITVLVSHQE